MPDVVTVDVGVSMGAALLGEERLKLVVFFL